MLSGNALVACECTLFVTFQSLIPVLCLLPTGHSYLKLPCGICSLPKSVILSLISSFLLTPLLYPQALRLKNSGIILFLNRIPTCSHLPNTDSCNDFAMTVMSEIMGRCQVHAACLPDCFRWDWSRNTVVLN